MFFVIVFIFCLTQYNNKYLNFTELLLSVSFALDLAIGTSQQEQRTLQWFIEASSEDTNARKQ